MAYDENTRYHREQPGSIERIAVSRDRILRSLLRSDRQFPERSTFTVLPTDAGVPPVYRDGFTWANIGPQDDPANPLLLELRLTPIDLPVVAVMPEAETGIAEAPVHIGLLMTNERTPRDLRAIAERFTTEISRRGIPATGVMSPEQLGWKLGYGIAERMGEDTPITSLQKGKPGAHGIFPPKPWIGMEHGISVGSGTSNQGVSQMLFLDPQVADVFRRRGIGVFYVDDARLTPETGTMDRSLTLLHEMGIRVVGAGTVLNEADDRDSLFVRNATGQIVDEVPYIALTKLPLHMPTGDGGITPIPGTDHGLPRYYVEE